MYRIAALLACHNRREETLTCLRALRVSHRHVPHVQLEIFLTDDGSTDGTADVVQSFDPGIHVVQGTGNLYWNRGMILAWQTALDSGEPFDAFLLVNDDVELAANAFEVLLETARRTGPNAIVVGSVQDPETGELSYGGVICTSPWHPGRTELVPASDTIQAADTLNANCALVLSACVNQIGILDPVFSHAIGDFDYGLRAKKAGIGVVVAPGILGRCRKNRLMDSWRRRKVSLRQRLAFLQSPRGLPFSEWRTYLKRHGAPAPGILALVPTLKFVMAHFRAKESVPE